MSTQPSAQQKAQDAAQSVLNHPFVQKSVAVADEQMKQMDQVLSRFPVLNDFENKTKVKKTHGVLALGGSFIVLIFFNLFGLASPVSNLIGWLIPAYLSCRALESPGRDDDKQWLTYWVIFSLFNFLESAAIRPILYYFPFYFVTKTVFTIYLWLPATRGAEVMYRNVVAPLFAQISGQKRSATNFGGAQPYSTTSSIPHEKTL